MKTAEEINMCAELHVALIPEGQRKSDCKYSFIEGMMLMQKLIQKDSKGEAPKSEQEIEETLELIEDAKISMERLLPPEEYGENGDAELIYNTLEKCKELLAALSSPIEVDMNKWVEKINERKRILSKEKEQILKVYPNLKSEILESMVAAENTRISMELKFLESLVQPLPETPKEK